MAEAKKALKKYKLGPLPYYRDGVYYEPHSEVEIPAHERPSYTWFDGETGAPVVIPAKVEASGLSDEEQALIRKLREDKAAGAAPKEAPKAVEAKSVFPTKSRAADKDAL